MSACKTCECELICCYGLNPCVVNNVTIWPTQKSQVGCYGLVPRITMVLWWQWRMYQHYRIRIWLWCLKVGVIIMWQCCSTWKKPWHITSRVFATKFKKAFAKLVILMFGFNLINATQPIVWARKQCATWWLCECLHHGKKLQAYDCNIGDMLPSSSLDSKWV